MLPRGLKTPPKSTQNRPKIAPWRTPGPPGGTKILFFRFGIDFGAQFGAPWHPKSTKKSIFCERNAPRSALSKQCLPGALHHLVFYILFWSFLVIFGQKTMKNASRCCASCWYFPPLKNHIFYRLPCLRTVFLQICGNTKNLAKKREKT